MRVLELFAGIGSWKKALDSLLFSYEMVDAIENDENAMKCYNLIHNTNYTARDIKDIDGSTYKDIDLVLYSPPCQSWSSSGDKSGFDERGMLFYEALRIIKDAKPKYAVMENVKNLTQGFKDDFDTMLDELDKAGYKNYWKVVNALDVGFPQNRERVFIVSVRKDIELVYEFHQKVELSRSFVELLETNWNKKYLHTSKAIEYMNRETTRGRTHWDFSHHNDTDKMWANCVTRNLWRGVPYNVLVDRSGVGVKVRRHTPLEVMRLMGFEDADYEALRKGKIADTNVYRVAGNSIVVDMCESILKGLIGR